MVVASYKRLLLLHCCWSLTMASDNFRDNSSPAISNETESTAVLEGHPKVKEDTSSPAASIATESTTPKEVCNKDKEEIKIQHLEGNVLRISCSIINVSSEEYPSQMRIFADMPSNILVSVKSARCPRIQAKDKHIYMPECPPLRENMFLDIFLTNYNPIKNQQFGCSYVYLNDLGKASTSACVATVSSPGNSSPTASSETQTPAALEESHEDKEGTTVRDNTLTDVLGETCERYNALPLLLIISGLTAILCALILLISVYKYKVCWKRNCRRVFSYGKTVHAERSTSKHDEHEDNDVYTTINIEVNEVNLSPDIVNDKWKRLRSGVSMTEIVSGKETYQEDYPYTQIRKSPMLETCAHNGLME